MVKRIFDAQIRKVGNSFVITVPSSIVKKFKLKQGSHVTTTVEVDDENNE